MPNYITERKKFNDYEEFLDFLDEMDEKHWKLFACILLKTNEYQIKFWFDQKEAYAKNHTYNNDEQE